MAKVKMPLLGGGASGTIGKSVVFGTWRGVNYARQHVVPANPNTAAQQAVRGLFGWLSEVWKRLPVPVPDIWKNAAKGRPYTGRNAFIGKNMKALQGQGDLLQFVASPGYGGGYPVASLSLTSDTTGNSITADATVGSLPSGWVVNAVYFLLLENVAPGGSAYPYMAIQSAAAAPYQVQFGGLEDGKDYVICAWAEYTDASGRVVAGPSINALSQVL